MLRVIIAGGRDFVDTENQIEIEMTQLCMEHELEDIQIVVGGALGADALGEAFARKHNTNLAIFPAQWEVYGKSAGYRRNKMMADNADVLLAFWDGKSKGTKHMIDLAKTKQLKVIVVNY